MKKEKYRLSASILDADFWNLGSEIDFLSRYSDELHLDVMDGHFVPNISFGPGVVKAVRKRTDLALDIHLMIENPLDYIDKFIDAGADMITFHSEADSCFKCLDYIKNKNVKVGVAYNPDTPIQRLDPDIDRVLIMSVHPGFGGQKFIGSTLEKISRTREYIGRNRYNIEIAVDGGINLRSAYSSIRHGADVVVSGSYIFKGSDKERNVLALKKALSRAEKKKRL